MLLAGEGGRVELLSGDGAAEGAVELLVGAGVGTGTGAADVGASVSGDAVGRGEACGLCLSRRVRGDTWSLAEPGDEAPSSSSAARARWRKGGDGAKIEGGRDNGVGTGTGIMGTVPFSVALMGAGVKLLVGAEEGVSVEFSGAIGASVASGAGDEVGCPTPGGIDDTGTVPKTGDAENAPHRSAW